MGQGLGQGSIYPIQRAMGGHLIPDSFCLPFCLPGFAVFRRAGRGRPLRHIMPYAVARPTTWRQVHLVVFDCNTDTLLNSKPSGL